MSKKLIANLVKKPEDNRSIIEIISELPEEAREEVIQRIIKEKYPDLGYKGVLYDWTINGRPDQLIPLDFSNNWNIFAINAGRGFGKSISASVPIITQNGWKTQGSLLKGDKVLDEHGEWCNVTEVHEIHIPEKCYRFYFEDGSFIDSSADHHWSTWIHNNRKQYGRHVKGRKTYPHDWVNYRLNAELEDKVKDYVAKNGNYQGLSKELGFKIMPSTVNSILAGSFTIGTYKTTQEIVDTFYQGKRKDLNHCIPNTLPVKFEKKELPIHPFVLGYWLGNGMSGQAGKCAAHQADIPELMSKIRDFGYECEYFPEKDNQVFHIRGLKDVTKSLNLINNKHVPEIYLYASVQQRLDLLRGLMTSDGGVDGASCVSYCSSRKKLADAVYWLVVSLGMSASRDERIPTYSYKGEKKQGSLSYRVSFTPTMDVFYLDRKSKLVSFDKTQIIKRHHRMIVGYEEIEPVPMRCISVDSPNRMYLAGEALIPTRNTRTSAEWARYVAEKYAGCRIALVGATASDVHKTMLGGSSGLLTISPPWFYPKHIPTYQRLVWPNGSIAEYFALDIETEVPTPDGIKTIKDIQIGDWIFDENLEKVMVKNVTPIMYSNKCYELVFLSGQRVVCDQDHLWEVFSPQQILFRAETHTGEIVKTKALVSNFESFNYFVRRNDPNELFSLKYEPIISIKEVESRPVKCLSVDSDSQLFLITRNYLTTHNSAEKPHRLRGPQFHFAWLDEFCAWNNAEETFDMLSFGLRLGDDNRILISTTPRNHIPYKKILGLKTTWTLTGGTFENKSNLSAKFIDDMVDRYENTRLGRQELDADILDEPEGALWKQKIIDDCRIKRAEASERLPEMQYIVVAVDPAVTTNKKSDETGICVAGYGLDGHFYVFYLESHKDTPLQWAKRVLGLYDDYLANHIVAETNQGGDLVLQNIKTAREYAAIYPVRAKDGKRLRAEPVAHLYELRKVHHVDFFPRGEDQMCSFTGNPKDLDDMVDALVMAITALMEKATVSQMHMPLVGGVRSKLVNYRYR